MEEGNAAVGTTSELAETPAPGDTDAPANDNGDTPELDADTLAAIEEGEPTPDGEPTVKLGDFEIPVSALADAPDDVLALIKRKIKANGEEIEVSALDAFGDAPLAKGAQRRMWEAAQREKQLQGIADAIGKDYVGAYAAMHGLSRREAVMKMAQTLQSDLALEAMDPEERAKADRQRELEAKAKRAEEYEKREKERRLDAQSERIRNETLIPAVQSALDAVGEPRTPQAMARVAEAVFDAMKSGHISGQPTDADYAWAAKQVAEKSSAWKDSYLGVEGDDLIERLGPKLAAKIARAYAKRVQSRRKPPERAADAPPPKPRSGAPQTWEEFFAERNRRMGID